MKKLILASSLAVATSFATAHAAEPLSYNYVDGFYNVVDFGDSIGPISQLDGFGIRGSIELGGGFFAHTGYRNSTRRSITLRDFTLGGGYAHYISPSALLYGTLDYRNLSASGPGSSESTDGLGLSAGVRGLVSPNMELRGGIRYDDFGRDAFGRRTDETFAELGAQFNINRNLGLIGEVQISSDDSQYLAGVRYSF